MNTYENDKLDSDKNSQKKTVRANIFGFDRNFVIGFILLAFAFYFINVLVFIEVSQEVQGLLVVIIGLLIIVGIDIFKKDSNTSNSNLKIPYPKDVKNSDIQHQNGDD